MVSPNYERPPLDKRLFSNRPDLAGSNASRSAPAETPNRIGKKQGGAWNPDRDDFKPEWMRKPVAERDRG